MLFCEAHPFQNSDDPEVHPVFRGKQHVHLMSDTEAELLDYMEALGVPQRWLQRDAFGVPHFDMTGRYMRRIFLDECVIKLARPEFVAAYLKVRAAYIADHISRRKRK